MSQLGKKIKFKKEFELVVVGSTSLKSRCDIPIQFICVKVRKLEEKKKEKLRQIYLSWVYFG